MIVVVFSGVYFVKVVLVFGFELVVVLIVIFNIVNLVYYNVVEMVKVEFVFVGFCDGGFSF